MFKIVSKKNIFIGLALGGVQFAGAQVNDYGLFKDLFYTQTDATTTVFNEATASERITTVNPGDITDAEVLRPNSTLDTLSQSGTTWSYSSPNYASAAALLNDWGSNPAFSYEFMANGDTLDSFLPDPQTMWAPNPPTVTNFSALQSYNVNQSLTVHFTPYTMDPNATNSYTFVSLYDFTTNSFVGGTVGPNSLSSFVIGAGTLSATDSYQFTVYDSNRTIYGPDPNFGFAIPYVSYDVVTSVNFSPTAVPEPATLLPLGLGALGLFLRRRKTA